MNKFVCFAVLLMSGIVLGCSRSAPAPTFSISGDVELDGRPLELALVRFIPKAEGTAVVATVKNGAFQLESAAGPAAGDYDVVVLPVAPELPQAIEAIEAGDRDPLKIRTVPLKYQSTGQLTATVRNDTPNQFPFVLRSR